MFFFPNAEERNYSPVFWGWKSGEKKRVAWCFASWSLFIIRIMLLLMDPFVSFVPIVGAE